MSIDDAIAHAREVADKNSGCWKHCTSIRNCAECEKEHEQLAEWLEELKEARKGFNENRKAGYKHSYSDGYAKAIDEFRERLKKDYQAYDIDFCLRDNEHFSYVYSCGVLESYVDEIAEELKGGGVE